MAAKAATTKIPVVFLLGEDPCQARSCRQPRAARRQRAGLNLFSGEMTAKRLEILREILPSAARLAVLVNPTGPNAETTLRDVPPAVSAMGLDTRIFKAGTSREISAAFEALANERPDALLVELTLPPMLIARADEVIK